MATVAGNTVKLNNGSTVTPQQGGWYDGQQFWNGTLSATGAINSQSNQPGAGQQVSNEVKAQSNPANVSYTNTQQVQTALNTAQNAVYQNYQSPDAPKVQSTAEIAAGLKSSGLLPTTTAPVAPNLLDSYNQLRDQQGLPALEAHINDLKTQEEALIAQTRVNVSAERGKPVAQNIIEGRVSEQQRNAQEQLDFVTRQKNSAIDTYNSALNTVKTIMDFTQKDYDNALQSYTTQFNQAITTINLVQGIQQDQKNDAQKFQDNARANAQIYVNALKEGNINLASLPPEQQIQLNKLEVQSGLPVGFFASIKADPKANIISTNSYQGQTQVLMKNPDGSISVQTYGTAGGSGGTDGSAKQNLAGLKADAQSGMTLANIIKKYKGVTGMTDNDIVENYNVYSKFGPAKETPQKISEMLGKSKAVPVTSLPPDAQANIKYFKDLIKSGQKTRDEVIQKYPEAEPYL